VLIKSEFALFVFLAVPNPAIGFRQTTVIPVLTIDTEPFQAILRIIATGVGMRLIRKLSAFFVLWCLP
jgi:hypothetical protein